MQFGSFCELWLAISGPWAGRFCRGALSQTAKQDWFRCSRGLQQLVEVTFSIIHYCDQMRVGAVGYPDSWAVAFKQKLWVELASGPASQGVTWLAAFARFRRKPGEVQEVKIVWKALRPVSSVQGAPWLQDATPWGP